MSIERVRKYFQQWNMADRILEFPVSSATVALAALALGCAEGRIAKTLAIKHGEGCLLVLLAGDTKLSSAKFKAAFGHKPSMLPPDETEALVGHAIGGVCPFGINPGISVYLDESLRQYETVFPACGSGNSAIELSPSELAKHADGGWVDVSV